MIRASLPLIVLFQALTTSFFARAEMPKHLQFVAHETPQKTAIVDVLESDAGYSVSLIADQTTILLQGARCRDVSTGYHCYIIPVRVRGILVTDVSFTRTTNSLFDIQKIVLIDGSFTAVAEIGKNFTLEQT